MEGIKVNDTFNPKHFILQIKNKKVSKTIHKRMILGKLNNWEILVQYNPSWHQETLK